MTRAIDVPEVIRDSAMVLAVVFHELGFSDKSIDILDRGKKFLDTTMTHSAADALGDDLDAMSVAVGFAAAMGAFASCLGAVDGEAGGALKIKTKTDVQELIRQMGKAEDN